MKEECCDWANSSNLLKEYHDNEWGKPIYDDETLFEFLILESFQAGLSWITILKKRDNFRKAFDQFDYKKIALYDIKKYEELIIDTGIIRNKLKVKSTISNAQYFINIQKEFGSFSKYIWNFVEGRPIQNKFSTSSEVPATTEISDKISKDLKKRGFKFVGSTIIYAFMQATGIVNDHLITCPCHKTVQNN